MTTDGTSSFCAVARGVCPELLLRDGLVTGNPNLRGLNAGGDCLSVSPKYSRIFNRKKVQNFLLLSKRKRAIIPVGNLKVEFPMKEKPDVLQGTLALMVLKTLDLLGPQHG